jgi:hypothetical protein
MTGAGPFGVPVAFWSLAALSRPTSASPLRPSFIALAARESRQPR